MQKEIGEMNEEELKEFEDKMKKSKKKMLSKDRNVRLEGLREGLLLLSKEDWEKIRDIMLEEVISDSKIYALWTEIMIYNIQYGRILSNKEALQLVALRIRNHKVLFG